MSCPVKTGRALHGFVPNGIRGRVTRDGIYERPLTRTILRGDTSCRGRFSLFFTHLLADTVLRCVPCLLPKLAFATSFQECLIFLSHCTSDLRTIA